MCCVRGDSAAVSLSSTSLDCARLGEGDDVDVDNDCEEETDAAAASAVDCLLLSLVALTALQIFSNCFAHLANCFAHLANCFHGVTRLVSNTIMQLLYNILWTKGKGKRK
jgi:hypothetical protein